MSRDLPGASDCELMKHVHDLLAPATSQFQWRGQRVGTVLMRPVLGTCLLCRAARGRALRRLRQLRWAAARRPCSVHCGEWHPRPVALLQDFNASLVGSSHPEVHIAKESVDRAPASRKMRATIRSKGITLFFSRPESEHAALCRPWVSRGVPQLRSDSVTGSGKCRLSIMMLPRTLWSCGRLSQGHSCVVA